MLVVAAIVGGAGWWYWNQAQTDPDAMEKFRGVSALVDKGKAKLDELTGSNGTEAAKPADPSVEDNVVDKRKSGKAAKPRTDDAPEATQDSAVAATQGAVQKCYAKDDAKRDAAKMRDFTHIAVDVSVDDTGLIKRATLRKKFGSGAVAGCVEKAVLQAQMPSGQAGERTMEYDLPVPDEK